jgi:hypothetical protein
MTEKCDYCGVTFTGGLRWRIFIEDDSVLCERCFPFSREEQSRPSETKKKPGQNVSAPDALR